ncbi:inositol polyphosphate 1-phosphatase [Contarinia nasturtii]|uniref:inositol polyphosphate 1-phosphatase n=1 Tax=Contarinia nasturtii TaxID=265458 RepID=UPI0012D3DED7|nr:inositol polyphosphate 1-phosphatase [Contarinia nasturtii]
MVKNIMEALVHASEKATNIARLCRQNEHLFPLLVEEKPAEESNPRFVKDFKTLADVLIQQTIRYDVGNLYPLVHIQGEETATFTNGLGESIDLEITDIQENTIDCLVKILDGDRVAAELLAAEVYRTVICEHGDVDALPDLPDNLDLSGVGIWIDPIDATQEYIKAETIRKYPKICASGLECVTVLIGLYDKGNGKPLAGIINQPFNEKTDTGYKSKIVWGVCMGDDLKVTNLPKEHLKNTKLAVVSSSEDEKYIKALRDLGYTVVYSAGAGYKIMKVICGDADLFLLSKNTTFKWDTCGPHAILNAIDGGLFKIEDIIESNNIIEIDYSDERENANEGGLLALRRDEKHILQDLYSKK